MNIKNTVPGFTAEASLYKRSGRYRGTILTSGQIAAGSLTSALMIDTGKRKPDVDCTQFPENQACIECNSTNPINCCKAARIPSGKCVVKQPPRVQNFPTVFGRNVGWIGGLT